MCEPVESIGHFDAGTDRTAYRAPQNASSGAFWLLYPRHDPRLHTIYLPAHRDVEERDGRGAELRLVEPCVPLHRERDAVELNTHAIRRHAARVMRRHSARGISSIDRPNSRASDDVGSETRTRIAARRWFQPTSRSEPLLLVGVAPRVRFRTCSFPGPGRRSDAPHPPE